MELIDTESAVRETTRRRKSVPLAIGGGVLAVALLGSLMLARASSHTNKVALSSEPRGVTVMAARPTGYRPTYRYVGMVEPWLQARVGPEVVAAYVEEVLVRPGDRVRRGDVLATLDCRNASASSKSLELQARSLEERQKAVVSEATRMQGLASGGFVAANELEQKEAQKLSTAAQLESLRAQLLAKQVEVHDCTLRAPFGGEVGARYMDPGAYARPGSTVVSIVNRKLMRVSADAPEVEANAITAGTPVRLHLLAGGMDVAARISRRSPSADPGTRTVHFEIDLEPSASTAAVPVGTTAEVFIDVGEPREATEVPLVAAKIRGDKATVVLVQGDIAKSRTVTVLGERGGSLFVESGELAGDALVVTEGRRGLGDGTKVVAKVVPFAGETGGVKAPAALQGVGGRR